jgi:phosphoserine/homoserine phosphotransferase
LVPEIWIAFAQKTGIAEFNRTTRDEPDYDKLMRYRIDLLDRHNLGLPEITEVIKSIDPLPGALEFLNNLREKAQVLIISDTFEQFARPLMQKLNWPTLLCNSLVVSPEGKIVDYTLRCEQSKLTTVKALQSCGCETIAAGDSFNDLGMIRASKAGFLFRTTDSIKQDNPDLKSFTEYDDFFNAIVESL